jgi:CRISPR-associated protein Cmr1
MPESIRLKLDLETVTPLFLSGAEPRGAPELRPPSLRGALRYWLRAGLGGVEGNNLQAVHVHEARILGSTNETLGGASTLVLRLLDDKLPQPQRYEKQRALFVRRGDHELRQPTGKDYLYWSMAEAGRVENNTLQPAKQFFPAGATFSVIMNTRPGAENAEASFSSGMAAFWLLLHLGGIGSRSRRTGGSLSVREPAEYKGLRLRLEGSQPTSLVTQLVEGVRTARKLLSETESGVALPLPGSASGDILHPDVCKIWLLGVWDSSDRAIEAIGAALRDFRSYREPDHGNVAKWLQGGSIATVERAVFGLPIPYRYSNGGPMGTVQGVLGNQTLDRRASPLWLHVSKTTTGKYVGVATLFASEFLPPRGQLSARTRNNPRPISPPADYSLIERWTRESFSGLQEVRYG